MEESAIEKDPDTVLVSNKKVRNIENEEEGDQKVLISNKNGSEAENKEKVISENEEVDGKVLISNKNGSEAENDEIIKAALAILHERDKTDPFLNVTANDLFWQPQTFFWKFSVPSQAFDDHLFDRKPESDIKSTVA